MKREWWSESDHAIEQFGVFVYDDRHYHYSQNENEKEIEERQKTHTHTAQSLFVCGKPMIEKEGEPE